LTERLEFNNGQWAEIRTRDDVTMEEKMRVQRARERHAAWQGGLQAKGYDVSDSASYQIMLDATAEDELNPWQQFCNCVVFTYTDKWSFGMEFHTEELAHKIPEGPYEDIFAVGFRYFRGVVITPDGANDPKVTTDSSAGSDPPSEESSPKDDLSTPPSSPSSESSESEEPLEDSATTTT